MIYRNTKYRVLRDFSVSEAGEDTGAGEDSLVCQDVLVEYPFCFKIFSPWQSEYSSLYQTKDYALVTGVLKKKTQNKKTKPKQNPPENKRKPNKTHKNQPSCNKRLAISNVTKLFTFQSLAYYLGTFFFCPYIILRKMEMQM